MKLINFGLFALLALAASPFLGSAEGKGVELITKTDREGCQYEIVTVPISLYAEEEGTGVVCVKKASDACGPKNVKGVCPKIWAKPDGEAKEGSYIATVCQTQPDKDDPKCVLPVSPKDGCDFLDQNPEFSLTSEDGEPLKCDQQ